MAEMPYQENPTISIIAMDIETFWNHAFLFALGRTSPEEAKKEADLATDLCIAHWQSHAQRRSANGNTLWQSQAISHIPQPVLRLNALADGQTKILDFRFGASKGDAG